MFAATPPLEVLTIMLSVAMAEGVGYRKGREEEGLKLERIDIKRAYLQAEKQREVSVELPEADREEGACATLRKAMYGTRDAAQSWEATCRRAHEDRRFTIRKSITVCYVSLRKRRQTCGPWGRLRRTWK